MFKQSCLNQREGPAPPLPCRRNAGIFTLIELMLTIAVIAILAMLLLPALNKARQLSQKTGCISNLKQIGTAVALYQTDNKTYLPVTYIWSGGGRPPLLIYNVTWDDLLGGGYDGRHLTKRQQEFPLLKPGVGGNSTIYRCPAYKLNPEQAIRSYRVNVSRYGSSKSFPDELTGVAANNNSACDSMIPNPSGTIMLGETSRRNCQVGSSSGWKIETPSPNMRNDDKKFPHQNQNGYLFCDGHVMMLRYQETIGKGTLDKPLGMWTRRAGD